MDTVDIIKAKRDGARLTEEQIRWFIKGYTDDSIPHYQASSLLMAILLNGMESEELVVWTEEMIASGERLDLSHIDRPTVDKHSTGGVGDKISLPLAPLVAACGAADPMLSGRGLGHTGGTLDKLESIPGFRVDLSSEEMKRIAAEVGCVISSAGPGLAPADRKLYALRDVTGTVESIPLIASSVMSKKIAEGTKALVLDVKVGSGAFMKRLDHARELAETMVTIGEEHGVKTVALITDMDQPLGLTAGNAIEVQESLDVLNGGGPEDVLDVTMALAREMLALVGIDADPATALQDGSALAKWNEMVRAQGGDPDAPLPVADDLRTVEATSSGYIARIDAMAVGVSAWRLGAGRTTQTDPVSAVAGVKLLKVAGQEVEQGEPIFELHVDDPARVDGALEALMDAVTYSEDEPEPRTLVHERIAR